MLFLPPFPASALTEPTFGKEALGAELFAFCHAEFISASLSGSLISEYINIDPESSSGSETLNQ